MNDALISRSRTGLCLKEIGILGEGNNIYLRGDLSKEHIIHDKLLHSNTDWIGKQIHLEHHKKDYFHISIDPPALLIGWLLTAHLLLRLMLPTPLAITATIGYAIAGMGYEWTHYIVHTKVKPKSAFMTKVRDNHLRHHLVDNHYWFAFTLPFVDDLFGTNPTVKEVRRRRSQQKVEDD